MDLRSLIPSRGTENLARPEPSVFSSLQREVDRLFNEVARGVGTAGVPAVSNLVPSIDITETDDAIEITAEMPGLERNDVEVSLEDNMLTIRGEKRVEEEAPGEKRTRRLVERSYGVFLRMLELPPGIDPSQIEATMSNGVLRIRIPKPSQSEVKKIEVKDAA